jgi:hypothetical protein
VTVLGSVCIGWVYIDEWDVSSWMDGLCTRQVYIGWYMLIIWLPVHDDT